MQMKNMYLKKQLALDDEDEKNMYCKKHCT